METERQALAQLALFEQDTASYKTPNALREEARQQAQEEEDRALQEAEARRLQDEADAVYLNAAFVGRFLEFIKDRTPKSRKDTCYYLSAWADALQGRDLRKVEPREVLKLLSQWKTAEQKRVAAFKAFCSFLIKKGFLDPAHDPSRTLNGARQQAREGHPREGLCDGHHRGALRDYRRPGHARRAAPAREARAPRIGGSAHRRT